MKGAILYAHGRSPERANPAATAIMFCSATPALMHRGPSASASRSNVWKPRSPVRNTKSGLVAAATRDWQKRLRMRLRPPQQPADTDHGRVADNAIPFDFP